MKLIDFIWEFVRKQKWAFGLVLFLCLGWCIDVLFWPFFLGQLVDVLTRYDLDRMGAWSSLKPLLLCGAFVWILIDAGFRTRDYLFACALPKMQADIRMTMFDHVQRHSPKYFNEHFSGSLANKIGDMVLMVTSLMRLGLIFFIPSLFICGLTIAIFARINPYLALIIGSWITVHLVVCWFFTKKCETYSSLHGESRSVLSGKIIDSLTNNFVVNLFFRFDFEREHIAQFQKEEQKANRVALTQPVKMFSLLSVAFATELFVLTGSIISLWVHGMITTGEVVQVFYTIWNVSMVVYIVSDRAMEFFQNVGIANQALTVMDDPQDILDPPNALNLSIKRGEIVFENVSFGYGEKVIFRDKTLKINSGEKVGLVGYSGAGKSTFVNLILKFFEKKGKF